MSSTRRGTPNEQRDGDRHLWCAVLHTAIMDASGVHIPGSRSKDNVTALRMRDEARDWLLKPNRDFNTVCYLAGLDPESVRERLKQREGFGK